MGYASSVWTENILQDTDTDRLLKGFKNNDRNNVSSLLEKYIYK